MSLDEKHWQKKLNRKRKAPSRRKPLQPRVEAYSAAQATAFPIHDSLAPKDLFQTGLGMVLLTRALPNGKLALSAFLVDVFCLGVKDAFYRVVSVEEHGQFVQRFNVEKIHPACLRKLVEGAVAYALALGFKPCADYAGAARLFGSIEAAVCPVRFCYGKDGKPLYISGPDDSQVQSRGILDKLKRRLGQEGFSFVKATGASEDDLGNGAPESLTVVSYEITEEPLPDTTYARLPIDVQERINLLHDEVLQAWPKPTSALVALKGLIQQYPDVPALYNYLYIAHQKLGQREEAAQVLQETVQRFPHYLFGRITWAEECLKHGEPEKVTDIFGGMFDLQLLYPERDRFHLSELMSFQSVVARYFHAVGDQEQAQRHYEIMRQIDPEHASTRFIGRVIRRPRFWRWIGDKLKFWSHKKHKL